ncbi:MAG: hypothetical protein ABIF01_05720 [Candidatus Micrarchaeota archaeon]
MPGRREKRTRRAKRSDKPKRQSEGATWLSETAKKAQSYRPSWWAITIVLAIGAILFFFYVFTQPPPTPVSSSYSEPLIPVTGLKFSPGETYVYEWYDQQMGSVRISNSVKERAGGCILVYTQSANFSLPFCIDEITGESKDPSNPAEPLNMSPQLFQPWMLALKENWTWRTEVNMTIEWMGSTEKIDSRSVYRVVSREPIKGRDAYKVIIETSVNRASNSMIYPIERDAQVVWVDAEKRILLYANSSTSKIELTGAPFKVEPYSVTK